MRLNFARHIHILPHSKDNPEKKVVMWLFLFAFVVQQSFAQPLTVDADFNSLAFLEANRTVVVDKGDKGFSQGSVHRFDRVLTRNGRTVYGLLTIETINNASILNFDDDQTFGVPDRFQPVLSFVNGNGGFVVYNLHFYDSQTNEDVFLNNFSITGIDLDGFSESNREFVELGGYFSYEVNDQTKLEISHDKSTGRSRFLGKAGHLSGMGFDNSCSFILHYSNYTNSISFALGQTGKSSETDYSLQFGNFGGSFSSPVVSLNPLMVATDDAGIPVNSNVGGKVIENVLSNDFFNGSPVTTSLAAISLTKAAAHSGVSLNTTTGAVSVAPGTPAGSYSLEYQVCMSSTPSGRCDKAEVQVKVLKADLSVLLACSSDTVVAGQNLKYTVVASNNGPTMAQNVKVTDVLPAGLSFFSEKTTTGIWGDSVWTIGDMNSLQSDTLQLVVRVASNCTGSLLNVAKISSSSTYDSDLTNNFASIQTVVATSADLSIKNEDSADPVSAGGNITYTISVTNNGSSDALNVTVNDVLPSGISLISSTCSVGTWSAPVWNIGTLKSGASATMAVLAKVKSGVSGVLKNEASVSSSTFDPNNGNNRVTRVTTITALADISITGTVNNDTIVAGGVVNYVFNIKNSGPGDVQSVQVFDTIPSEIQFVQYSFDKGANWSSWSSPCVINSLKAGDSITIQMLATVLTSAVHHSVVPNSMAIGCATPDPNYSNNRQSVSFVVSRESDLSVGLTGSSAVIAGEEVSFLISVVNNGPGNSDAVLIADTLSPVITNTVYSLDNGNTWNEWKNSISLSGLNYPGSCNVLIKGDVSPDFTGELLSKVSVLPSTVDNNLTNNYSTITSVISNEADLVLSATETVFPILKGGQVTYSVSVFNRGPSDAVDVVLTDHFNPSLFSNVTYYDGKNWIAWTGTLNLGTLKSNSVKNIRLSATLSGSAGSPVENTVSVVSSVSDSSMLNNSQTIKTPLGKIADISVVRTIPSVIAAGEQLVSSIVVTNNSSDTGVSDVTLTNFPDGSRLSDVSYSIDGGVTWKSWDGVLNIGTLGFGKNTTIAMRGTVLANAQGTINDSVWVSCNTPDQSMTNNVVESTVSIHSSSDISVVKTILTSKSNIVEGSSIKYLLTYTNEGPGDAAGFTVADMPADGLSNLKIYENSSEYIPWSGSTVVGTVVAGGSGSLVVTGTVGSVATVSNTATVTSNADDPNSANNSSQVVAAVTKKADLRIAVSEMANPLVAGETFQYALIVSNSGPSVAQNITVSHVLPVSLQNAQYSVNNGLSWDNWGGTYLLSSLSSGNQFKVLMKAKVKSDVANGSFVSFSATVGSTIADPESQNNTNEITVSVESRSDLLVKLYADKKNQDIGGLVKFTLMAKNNGPSKASSVLVSYPLPSGFRYISDNGNGTYNPESGVWTVGPIVSSYSYQLEMVARVLSNGSYYLFSTIDGEGKDPDYSNNTLILDFKPDAEAVYSVAAPKNVDLYRKGEVLATVTDEDVSVESAVVSGSLPSGVYLNSSNGEISVSDSSLLVAGKSIVTITTTDFKGGVTIQSVAIEFIKDSESVYTVTDPRNENDYATNEVIASVRDEDGPFSDILLISGTIPPGTSFDIKTGAIIVSNPFLISGGSYPLTISTVDKKGGRTTQTISLVFIKDNESVYAVNSPKQVAEYENGDTLASVTDADGSIIYAELVARVLPEGSELDAQTGAIMVTNQSLLVAGSYWVRINTSDEAGGTTSQLVMIKINSGLAPDYTIELSRNIDTYTTGDSLAYLTDASKITSAVLVSGTLPPGTSLNSVNGTISVTNLSKLAAGSYSPTIKINGVATVVVNIIIDPDIESVYKVEPAKNLSKYVNGDLLASVSDKDGAIVSAVIQYGILPAGMELNRVTGEITVADASELVSTTNIFQVKTTDETGGITSQLVTISFVATDLSITQTCSSETAFSGENLVYKLTVSNNGNYSAQGVKVIDVLPYGLTISSCQPSVGTWDSPIWDIGTLLKGASVTLNMEVKINSGFTGTITNSPTITSLTSDPVSENNTSSVSTVVTSHAALKISLASDVDTVFAGNQVTYSVTVLNNGPSDAKNVLVTDPLPSGVSFVSASDGGFLFGNKVQWNLANMPVGKNYEFSFTIATNSNIATGSVISNQVSSLASNATETATSEVSSVFVEVHSLLTIQESASSAIVVAGENVTYTFTVTNQGPSDASNLVITDEIPSTLTFVSTSGGGILKNGIVTWKPASLSAGADYTCTLIVKVNGDVPNGTIITNHSLVKSDASGEPAESNVVSVEVKTLAELEIAKIASSGTVIAGDELTYLITVKNVGKSDAVNVLVTDELPSNLTFIRASDGGTSDSGVVTWNIDKLIGDESHSFTLVVKVMDDVDGGTVIANKAKVTSDNSEKPVESDVANVSVESQAVVEIQKTASVEVVQAGNELTYSIAITNLGPSVANQVLVSDTLPAGLTFVAASNSGVFQNGVVHWSETTLGVDSVKTYSLSVLVNSEVQKGVQISNMAYAESDNSKGKSASGATITVDAVSDLDITLSAPSTVIAGDQITYSIHLFNNGPNSAPKVRISDILPDGVVFVSASGNGTFSNKQVFWDVTSLSVGESQDFTWIVMADEGLSEGYQITNIASVISDNNDVAIVSKEVTTTVKTLSLNAEDDEGSVVIGSEGGIAVANVLANDRLNNLLVDISQVGISLVSSTSELITLDLQSGEVYVNPGTPAGNYELVYKICLRDFSDRCSEATVHVSVSASVIKANDDAGDISDNEEGGIAIENVVENDLLNGKAIDWNDVEISLVTPASVSGIHLDSESGMVTVNPGTLVGTYELTYKVCEALNPSNCDEAVAAVTVQLASDCVFLVPTAFSPNEDGVHDYFQIKCIERYPNASIEIFNRWGNLVYKKEKYGNVSQWGEADAWWGGYSNRSLSMGKEKLPTGTYFYILKLNSGEEAPVTGTVFLNR